jgi:hypothetical protein
MHYHQETSGRAPAALQVEASKTIWTCNQHHLDFLFDPCLYHVVLSPCNAGGPPIDELELPSLWGCRDICSHLLLCTGQASLQWAYRSREADLR